jgi:site-specific DNA-methyltransferase (adenine-specific)
MDALSRIQANTIPLIYIDPPFNTGKTQQLQQTSGGFAYTQMMRYADSYTYYLQWLMPHVWEAWRILAPNGTLYVHLDWHEVHYAKVAIDQVFGRACFLNEIIWAYDYGARTKKKWPTKHDTILVYVKDPDNYVFNYDAIDRIPYMAPSLQTPERAAAGKTPTDTWWHTIVSTVGYERTGYPSQKPVGILRRILLASSNPGDVVVDFFAGSGTTAQAALDLGRDFIAIDSNLQAFETMKQRFSYDKTVTYEDRLRVEA